MLVGSVADVDLDDWWRVMDVNVRGPMIWTRAVLPGMCERNAVGSSTFQVLAATPSTLMSARTARRRLP